MSKRNIAYVKPEDPTFLARLKNQIGYKEGPTVETKKQKLEREFDSDEDSQDREGEKPLVVVLKEGDLTAEEAEQEAARLAREAAEAPADLSKRIIFKKRNPDSNSTKETVNSATTSSNKTSKNSKPSVEAKKSVSKKSPKNTNKLSFNNEDDEE